MSDPHLAILAQISNAVIAGQEAFGVTQLPDGTGPAYGQEHADAMALATRRAQSQAILNGTVTHRHSLLAETYAVLTYTDQAELRDALMGLAGTVVEWITDIDRRAARR